MKVNLTTEIRRIDFSKIAMQSAREYKIRSIRSEINAVGGIDKILITDCLSNRDRHGLLVMKTLAENVSENPTIRYKIKVIQDRWGKPVVPGDLVEWKFERKRRDMFGKKITNRVFKEYIRRGEEREVEIWHEAIVDERGCIDVPFKDAAVLLDTRGVHFQSGQPLTNMPEFAKEVTRDHYDKDWAEVVGRQHFWLYAEVPRDTYQNLPYLSESKKQKKSKVTTYQTDTGV